VSVAFPSTSGHTRVFPAVPRFFPAPSQGRPLASSRWLVWLVAVAVVLACGIAGQAVRAAEAVAPDELAVRATVLEREQRWADVVAICETAARKGTLSAEVQRRYDLAKIHCDLARRHCEQAFRSQLGRLAETDARRLYAEVLGRIASHHVEAPQFARLVSRGCLTMDVAIDDPTFASLYLAQDSADRRALYRDQVARITAGRTIGSAAEAETLAAWVARAGHATLGIPPAVTLMEMTAAAVGGLDEYSAFLTNGQLDDLYAQIEGNFVGLGVELKSAEDGLLVVHVIAGSPAERAGIRAGDHLVGVGGRSIGGMNVDEAAQLLQGPEGSVVTLAILRAPSPARAVTVRREHVEVPSVENVRLLDPATGVAYLKISSFQKTTAADLEAALRRLDVAGMRSLVIDLRGNPGGLLSAAVDVSDLFLERGLVVATRGRSPDEDFNYSASRPGTWRMPLVVVIDGESASSSEIFAGAMRDHGRATLVGTRSYGKGSIQGIFPLDVGGVGMRLTTAKFFSPKGLPYSRVGVEPDLVVQSVARPAAGVFVAQAGDPFLDAALEAARRTVAARPVAKPVSRSTAAR
jgi:carboxyl-terminal processing protease